MSFPTAEPFPRIRDLIDPKRWAERLIDKLEMHARSFALLSRTQTFVNGNNNNINLDGLMLVRITGPTATFTITGIARGVQGQVMMIHNSTSQIMTIAHLSVSSGAANQIVCPDATDFTTTAFPSSHLLYYDNNQWQVMGCPCASGAAANVTGVLMMHAQGNAGTAVATATPFMPLASTATGVATLGPTQIRIPRTITIVNLYVRLRVALAGGGTMTIAVNNGSTVGTGSTTGAPAVTISSGGSTGNSNGNAYLVLEDAFLAFEASFTGGTTTATVQNIAFSYTATDD